MKTYNLSAPCALYKFVMMLGIVPLNGTTDENHMKEDIDMLNNCGDLSYEEVKSVADLIGEDVSFLKLDSDN